MGDTASLLTPRQREYLDGEVDPSNESQMRARIRERFYRGMATDASKLADLPPTERRRIFREWENRGNAVRSDVESPAGANPVGGALNHSTFSIGVRSLLGFLYLGVEETNVGDFEELLKDGIDQAVRERGQHVSDLTLEIEFGDMMTLGEVFEELKSGDLGVGDLTVKELKAMIESDEMDLDELGAQQQSEIQEALENMKSLSRSLDRLFK